MLAKMNAGADENFININNSEKSGRQNQMWTKMKKNTMVLDVRNIAKCMRRQIFNVNNK